MNRVSQKTENQRSTAAQTIKQIGLLVGNMTNPRKEQIMAEALRHIGSSGEYTIPRLVSKNLGVQERVVTVVILASYLEERTRRATLEAGVLGAVDAGRLSARAVWDEIRMVATA